MDSIVKKKRQLGEIPPGVEIIDLDALPEPNPPVLNRIKEEDTRGNDVEIEQEQKEPQKLPNEAKKRWSTIEDPVRIDDPDEPMPMAPMPAAPASNPPSVHEGAPPGTTVGDSQSTASLPTNDMDLDPPAQAPKRSVAAPVEHSIDESPTNATIVSPQGGARNGTRLGGGGGQTQVARVTNPSYRERLNAARRAAARTIAEVKEKKEAEEAHATRPAARYSPTPSVEAGQSQPRSSRKQKCTKSSSDEDALDGTYSLRGAPRPRARPSKGKSIRKQKSSGGRGFPGGDPPSSGDNRGDSDSDAGLFVTRRQKRSAEPDDDDVDMDEDPQAQQAREEADFQKRTQEYKKKKRQVERKRADGTLGLEEDVVWMRYERDYDDMVRKHQDDQERNAQSDSDLESQADDQGEGDGLFEPFETRQEQEQASSEMDILDGDDGDEDLLRQFDTRAKASRGKMKASASSRRGLGDGDSAGELVGSRKKSAARRGPRKKRSDSGKSKKKGKEKATNNRVQDKNGKVSKKGVNARKRKFPTTESHSMLDVGSLLTGDVFRDSTAHGGRPALPGFTSANKTNALKSLLSSLPKDVRVAARADKRAILSATRDFTGFGAVKVVAGQMEEENQFHVRGMVSHLRPHQLLGAAFMRRRERDTIEPRGGICADQMGLGKTVMMLANMINGKPDKKDKGPKTTLIVANNALVDQWFAEIPKHCGPKAFSVLQWTAKTKLHTNDNVSIIEKHDVVLTTYDEVRRSHPKAEVPIDLQTAEAKSKWWKDYFDVNCGVLHQAKYLRVVLDEAQAIKNYKSHTSVACRGLEARHRWALSGTPIQNAVQELYPYFNFLKVKHIGTFKIFFANFIGTDKKPSLLGIERLNQLLARFMIRRTHADKVMGHRLVTLPHASQQIRWCTFNDVERSIYEIVRARMIKRINKLSRSKKLDANYSHVLTMLLRLRQLTGHLLMLQGPMQDLLEIEDHEKIVELAQIEGHANRLPLRAMQIKRLRELIAKGALHNDQHHPARTNFPGVQDNYRRNDSFVETEEGRHDSGSELVRDRDNIGRIHGLQYNFLKYLKTLRAGANMTELRDRTTCVSCNDRAEDPMVTSCYHVYCSECIEAVMNDAALEYQDQARCKECGIKFDDVKACDNFDLDQMDENLDIGDTSDTDTELLKKNRSRKKKKKDQKRKDEDWIDQEGVNILPSAKTLGIKAQILNWISENPNVKVIIFTQFIDMIRILSKVCQAERWVHTTYHGGRSQEARKQAIKHFQLNPEIRVLLASLKAGGIGLNLTMAQKVIVVDPWWNNAVEQQAFCRVFRIGQDQETSLTRFAVENTVDQNMIEMQQRKQAEIDQVMGEKPRKLTVTELLKLFGGEVGEDEDGQPFIFAENKDTLINPLGDDEEMQDDD